MSVPDDEAGGLAVALAERALARATLGTALAGVVVGLLALVFLVLSGGRLDASTIPVVVLLLLGQVGGLAAAAACAIRLRGVRSGARSAPVLAGSAARSLDLLVRAVGVAGVSAAVALSLVLEPRGRAVLSAVLGLGVLAQVVVAMAVLRSPLRRAARAPVNRTDR